MNLQTFGGNVKMKAFQNLSNEMNFTSKLPKKKTGS